MEKTELKKYYEKINKYVFDEKLKEEDFNDKRLFGLEYRWSFSLPKYINNVMLNGNNTIIKKHYDDMIREEGAFYFQDNDKENSLYLMNINTNYNVYNPVSSYCDNMELENIKTSDSIFLLINSNIFRKNGSLILDNFKCKRLDIDIRNCELYELTINEGFIDKNNIVLDIKEPKNYIEKVNFTNLGEIKMFEYYGEELNCGILNLTGTITNFNKIGANKCFNAETVILDRDMQPGGRFADYFNENVFRRTNKILYK